MKIKSHSNPTILSTLEVYVSTASIISIGVGVAVLTGWFFDNTFLKSIFLNAATMKANTALCFLLAGVSLWLLRKGDASPKQKRMGQVFAILILFITLPTLSQYIFGLNLGFDQFLVKDLQTASNAYPGRMSQITTICFILISLALLQIGSRLSQYFSIFVFTLVLLALIGYLFDFESLYRLPGYGSVAVHTAFTFLVVSLGILAAQPTNNIMQTLTSNLPGSARTRILLPTTIFLIVFLAWLIEQGESRGLLNSDNKTVILVTSLILIYTPLLYFSAKYINQSEEKIIYGKRLYATLSQVNQTIVRSQNQQELFETICKVAVDFGEFRLAWIGLLEENTHIVRPVAFKGVGIEIFESITINLDIPPFDEGLLSRAFTHEKIETSDNLRTDNRMKHWYQNISKYGYHSAVVIPFHLRGKTIGFLSLYATEQDFFKRNEEILLLEEMALDISFALDKIQTEIERKRAEEKIHRQLNYLTALQDIDRTIASAFDIHISLDTLISKAISMLEVDAATVLLINYTNNTLEFAAGDGFRTNAIKEANVKIGESYAGMVALKRYILKIQNLKDEPNNLFATGFLEGEDFVSYYGVPLIAKGKVIGVLEVFQRSLIKRDQDWLDFLNTLAGQAAIAIDNAQLFSGLQRSNIELSLAYDATIEGWSAALDLRDKETEGHSQRVTEMTVKLARRMGVKESELVHIRRGALLHDIGKLGIPDQILLKPEKLTKDEWETMQKHPAYAYNMLLSITYLKYALDIPYSHHEKWDGTGYPRGLKSEGIPLAARIFAIVDVWDALTSDRPYRKRWTKEQAQSYIEEQSGKHFDPQVVEVFLKLLNDK